MLLVLQARDAAGKDGTVRSIFSGLNPAGVDVTSFKVPAGREKVQDYLWRVHMACPSDGEIGVFNRSHYEDVLVVRVKGFVPDSVWKKRYRHINEFERMLTDEGTTIIKCFLNVSKAEQARRFQDRLDDPTKRWKFREGRPRRSQAVAEVPGRPTTTSLDQDVDVVRARGTSFPRITTGSATSPSPRSCCRR